MLDKQSQEQVVKAYVDGTKQPIADNIKPSWEELRAEAQLFVNQYNQLEDRNLVLAHALFNELMEASPQLGPLIRRRMSDEQDVIYKAEYLAAFRFDDAMTRYREQLPRKVIFVHEGRGGRLHSYEMDMQHLVFMANPKDKNRFTQSKADLTLGQNMAIEDNKQLTEKELWQIELAGAAYAGSRNRLEVFYKQAHSAQRQHGLLLWKEGHKWAGGWVLNYGDMKEAYVAAIFDQHEDKLSRVRGEAPYFDHSLIRDFFTNYIANVSNLAAVVEEDVVLDHVQYGVKSKRAELPSIMQYLNLAKLVAGSKEALSKEEIEEYLNQEYRSKEGFRNVLATQEQIEQSAAAAATQAIIGKKS